MSAAHHEIGPFSFDAQSVSDVGLVRKNNEDSLIEAPDIGLYGVCDGLGGHAAGEVASAIAAVTLKERLRANSSSPDMALRSSIQAANDRILQEQISHPEHEGMGTTVSAVWMVPDQPGRVWIVHVGDSRIYRMRGRRLRQVTEDHSPVFRLHKKGALTKDQIQEHPQKNLLDKSLGILPAVEADVFQTDLAPGDRILVCTDGLSDALKDREIETILNDSSIEQACRCLVEAAKRKGGHDNITLALLEILETGDWDQG